MQAGIGRPGAPRRYPRGGLAGQAEGERTLRLQMMRLGCSSTGSERMSAATSSAVFHLASWLRRFWPAHTLQCGRASGSGKGG